MNELKNDPIGNIIHPDWKKVSSMWLVAAITTFAIGTIRDLVDSTMLYAVGGVLLLISYQAYKFSVRNPGSSSARSAISGETEKEIEKGGI